MDADGEFVRQVHICIDCAEKIEYLPQAFADGKLIKHDAAVFDDCPKIYHTQNEDGEEVPNRKWKTMARDSIAPPNGTEREKKIRHIMESIARKMKKNGMTNLKTAEEMMAEFNEEEEKITAAATDWICQIVPGTGKEKGACLLYAHRCDMERVKHFQPERVMKEIRNRVKSGKMIVAPLKHCSWWMTIGADFVEKQIQKQIEWGNIDTTGIPQYLVGKGWDMNDVSKALWMCGICAETHCPKVDLKDRILALAGLPGTLLRQDRELRGVRLPLGHQEGPHGTGWCLP